MEVLPADLQPELTRERLAFVASLFTRARQRAFDQHNPYWGGDKWCLGTVAYSFSRFLIRTRAHDRDSARLEREIINHGGSAEMIELDQPVSWLGIINPGMKFIFSIGGIPIRFYSGDPAAVKANVAHSSNEEQLALALVYGSTEHSPDYTDGIWRIALNVSMIGDELEGIYLVHASDLTGEIYHSWMLETDAQVGAIVCLPDEVPAAVDVPPAIVTRRSEAIGTARDPRNPEQPAVNAESSDG